MMHDGSWFGMGGMGYSWWIPILVAVVVILAWRFGRARSR